MRTSNPEHGTRVTRRTVIASAVTSAVALAGCIADRNGNGAADDETDDTNGERDEPDDEPDDGEDDDREMNGTEGEGPGDGEAPEGVADVTFEVLNVESGIEDESASVTFEDDGLLVEGTITGNNSCYTARIAEMSLSDGEFTLSVESYEDADEDQMCAQELVDITYEAVVEFDDRGPETVVVEHNSSTVATDER
jgi:hypothetical protein